MRIHNILASVCFLAAALQAAGQEAEPCRDFRFLTDTDPLFSISNPAAISGFRGHISMAEAEFRKDNGALAGLSESPDSWQGGAATESYISISDRISFHGRLAWSYFAGQQMGAQVLMDPDFNPVNFLESTDATTGRRNKETYSLLGAVSYRLGDKWAAGVSFDYVSADQTKVKDPRFSSIWMDMGVKAGVSFLPSENLMLGLSLVYRNTLEQMKGGIYGTTDKQYFVYTDKGGYFGTLSELTGDLNHISMTNLRPMKNDFYGVSLQVAGGFFSNELEALYRSGYYGQKASSTATFFEFSGPEASYRGTFIARKDADIHRASVNLGYSLLGNHENVFKYVTPEGQNTRVEYAGSNHILNRHDFTASLSYVWYKGAEGYLPELSVGAAVDGNARIDKVLLYPFYRNAERYRISADAFVRKNFFSGRSIFTLGTSAIYRIGFGTPREDGTYAETISTNFQSFDNYMYRQFEYDTAPAVGAGLEFTYTRLVSARFVPYVKLSDSFSALLQAPQYLDGRSRNVALVTLGCSF